MTDDTILPFSFSVRLEQERQGATVGREIIRETCCVFRGLGLHASKRTLGLRFYCTQRFAINIEQVIRKAESRLHRKLADSDAAACCEVKVVPVLHKPTRRDQFRINFLTGFLLGCFRHGRNYLILFLLLFSIKLSWPLVGVLSEMS
jgi:hypothetical protein